MTCKSALVRYGLVQVGTGSYMLVEVVMVWYRLVQFGTGWYSFVQVSTVWTTWYFSDQFVLFDTTIQFLLDVEKKLQ